MEIYFGITTRRFLFYSEKMYCVDSKIYTTKKPFDIIDITHDIQNFITEKGCKNGLVNVFTRHTTAVLKINEAEE
jgi:thiamine phosphate synthase YjbQ (UPF0047 family)